MNYYNDNELENILTLVIKGLHDFGVDKFSIKKFVNGLIVARNNLKLDQQGKLEAMGINLFKDELSDSDYMTVSDALKGVGYIHKDLENEDIIHIDDTIEEDFESDVNNGQEYSCDACDIACLVIPPIWGEVHETSTQGPVE